MLRPTRQSHILALARRQGAVRIAELSRRLGVSAPTIRRDLASLVDRGLLARVHGGALAVGSGGAARPAALLAAAGMVRPGAAVGLSAGAAAVAVAGLLRAVAGLTVVTPAPACARVFTGSPAQTVVLVGGVCTPSGGCAGPLALDTIRQVNLDVAFVAAYGVSEWAGATAADLLTAQTDRALLAAARCRVVVAEADAWGRVGVAPVAGFDELDAVLVG